MQLTILGSTGSIGVNTLDVVRRHPERYQVLALCANRQIDRLYEQCLEFRPRHAVVGEAALAVQLAERLRANDCTTQVAYGPEALVKMASLPEVLQSAAIGIPDEKTGELIKVFIVVKPGMTLTKEQVMAHMRANLTAYKAPKIVEFRDSLPTTNVGKILRRELRDEEMKKLGLKK